MITEQELVEIRDRHEHWEPLGDDVYRLLDEIDRLHTSDKTLREQVRQLEQAVELIRESIPDAF